jgi:recombination protein RecA
MDKETQASIAAIRKTHGESAIIRLGDKPSVDIPCISTGSLGLDIALGGKGWPKGRIIEVYGPESGGKTTLCLHSIAQAQQFGRCALIDAEHAFDPTWARKLGLNCDELLVCQPDNGEQALHITSSLIDVKEISMIVIDSVAALVPKAELEGEIGDAHVGRQARMMSQAMRMMVGKIAHSNCVVIFINQIREKVGVMFGSPEVTPGGRALKFFASCRVDIRRIAAVTEGGKEDNSKIGHRVRCKVVKNKIAPPFRESEFDLLYDRGIDRFGEIIDLGLQHKILARSGAWIKLGDEMIGQGRAKARDVIADNPVFASKIQEALLPIIGPK